MNFITQLFIALMLVTSPADAGWWTNFCTSHLIAESPWPYGDMPAQDLARAYTIGHDPEVLKEIDYRLGLRIPDDERVLYLEVMK